MAEQPDVDLGSVGFGLVANTESLERSLGLLTRFGDLVNRVIASSNDSTNAYARQQAQIEKTLTGQFSQIERVSARLQRFGSEGKNAIDQINSSYERLVQTTSKGEMFNPQELTRGYQGMNAELQRAVQLEKELTTAARQAAAQQEALFKNQQRASSIITNLQVRGADPALIGQTRAAIAGYERDLRGATLSTDTLQERSRALTATLNDIVRASKMQSAAVAEATRAMREQEAIARQMEAQRRAVFQAQQRTSTIVTNLEVRGAPSQLIDQAKTALHNYERALQSTALSTGGLAANTRDYVAATMDVVRASKVQAQAIADVARAQKEQEAAARAALAQQKQLVAAQEAGRNMVSTLTVRGAPQQVIDQARAAVRAYEQELARGTLSAEQLQGANQRLAGSLGAIRRSFAESEAAARLATRAQADYLRQVQSVGALNIRAGRLGVDQTLIDANIAALGRYRAAISNLGAGGQTAALSALQQAMQNTKAAMDGASQSGGKLATFMYDLNKASVLLMGPLSGASARISVLASLFENTNLKTVALVGGMVGAAAAFVTLGTGAVKASMEFERFNALLSTTAGSPALVGEEMAYLVGQADKYGQSLRGLIPAYTNFGTAARLSGMSLKDQRDVFESIMVTGAALRFDTERTNRAFLALEQMVSKGTVQMQELKLQFGEAVPGAMQIAAGAMNKTTAELLKMMEKGELLTKDFLPKLQKALKDMFGAGALEGAVTLQAELTRLENKTLLFNKALDDNIRASTAVRAIVMGLADAIGYLTVNMSTLVPIIGAVIAAISALGLIAAGSWILRLVSGVSAASGVMAQLGGVATRLGALLTLTPGGAIGMFAKLAAVVGSAIFAYNAFSETTVKAAKDAETFAKKSDEWLNSVDAVGYAHDRTYRSMRDAALNHLKLIQAQIEATLALAQASSIQAQASRASSVANIAEQTGTTPQASARRGGRAMLLGILGDRGGEQEEVAKATKQVEAVKNAEIDALKKAESEIMAILGRMSKITDIRSFGGGPGKTGKDSKDDGMGAWNNWVDRVQKQIREVEMQDKQLTDAVSKSAMNRYEAEKKAADLIAGMPDKKRGTVEPLIKQLEQMGFVALSARSPIGRLQEALEQLFFTTEQNKDKFKEIANRVKEFEDAARAAGDAAQELREKMEVQRTVLAGGNLEDVTAMRQIEKKVREQAERLQKIMSPDAAAKETQQYRTDLMESRDLDKLIDKQKELRREVDQMVDSWGNKAQKALADYNRQLDIISQAQVYLNMTQTQADQLRQRASDDLLRKQLDNANEWVKQFSKIVNDLEKDMAEGLADMFMGTGGGWKDMLKKMERDMLVFMNRMFIMKPMMTALFGDLYTQTPTAGAGRAGGGGGNFGILGGLAQQIIPGLFNMGGGGASGAVASSWESNAGQAAPSVGGGGFLGMLGSMFGSMFSGSGHMGAMVGAATHMRDVSPAVFMNAPRLHMGGLLNDEVPFIGRRGERLLSPQQTRDYDSQRGGRPVNVSVQYVLQGAMDKKSQSQGAVITGRAVRRALERDT